MDLLHFHWLCCMTHIFSQCGQLFSANLNNKEPHTKQQTKAAECSRYFIRKRGLVGTRNITVTQVDIVRVFFFNGKNLQRYNIFTASVGNNQNQYMSNNILKAMIFLCLFRTW
ncbi:hypothetical protein XENOCAPTIV_029058 [Xenoophorus captivus]|uniref:Secreted protein n=1 Tax=Xenoophorus captivus TaxID=1517983 RepID=A0ABV0RMP8_9TELE